MYKAISKHVIQRYKDRGLDVTHLYRDLHTRNLKRMITRKDGIKKNLIFNAFDILPLDEFKKGKSSLNCFKRKEFFYFFCILIFIFKFIICRFYYLLYYTSIIY